MIDINSCAYPRIFGLHSDNKREYKPEQRRARNQSATHVFRYLFPARYGIAPCGHNKTVFNGVGYCHFAVTASAYGLFILQGLAARTAKQRVEGHTRPAALANYFAVGAGCRNNSNKYRRPPILFHNAYKSK